MSYVGIKNFELLWEKYIPLKWHVCEVYIGSSEVDAWPKPILWWVISFYWKPAPYLALIYNALSETVVGHVLFCKERIWKVIYSARTLKGFLNLWIFLPVFGISRFSFQLHLLVSFNHNAFCLFSNASCIWGEFKERIELGFGVVFLFSKRIVFKLSWFLFSDILTAEEIGHPFWWTAVFHITHNLN